MKLLPPTLTVKDQRRLMFWVTSLDEVMASYTGLSYMGHSLKRDNRGWLLVIKAEGRAGKKVAFFTGHRPWVCWMGLAIAMKTSHIRWLDDRPPPNTGA